MAATAPPETAGSPRSSRTLPLTPGRRAALVIGVPVCLALVGVTGFSTLANFAEGKFSVGYSIPATTKSLVLTVNGQLTVKSTPARQGAFDGTARYAFIRPTPAWHQTSRDTAFGYQCPLPVGDCELDGTVTVPASVTTLTVNSGSGAATVTGGPAGSLTGPVTLSTGDGNVSASHVSGPLSLNTDSGEVSVSAITSATVSASSGDGDINADGVTSPTIFADTDSGNITWQNVGTGTITASTGDGNIYITFTGTPPRNVNVDSDNGNISLYLPPGSATTPYNVTTDNGGNGTIQDSGIDKVSSARNTITATTGNGNILIAVTP
jgi:Putative adhesin